MRMDWRTAWDKRRLSEKHDGLPMPAMQSYCNQQGRYRHDAFAGSANRLYGTRQPSETHHFDREQSGTLKKMGSWTLFHDPIIYVHIFEQRRYDAGARTPAPNGIAYERPSPASSISRESDCRQCGYDGSRASFLHRKSWGNACNVRIGCGQESGLLGLRSGTGAGRKTAERNLLLLPCISAEQNASYPVI